MKWFWQSKENVDIFAQKLPENIILDGKRWGLRIKKENGKWYTRYVTRSSNKEIRKKGGYTSFNCGGAYSISRSLEMMVQKLKNTHYEIAKSFSSKSKTSLH